MKFIVSVLYFVFLCVNLHAQTCYTGTIDNYSIELVLDMYSDNEAKATYVYTNYDQPIKIQGKLKNNVLLMHEQDTLGNLKAILTFNDFNAESNTVVGTWQAIGKNKQLPILLTKKYALQFNDNAEYKNIELLQPNATSKNYFKVLIEKQKGDSYPKVVGINVYEKVTDKLVQTFALDCQLWGIENVTVNDYNFDGKLDFAVFEQSYTGPNTSSIYFLYTPKTKMYFKSTFTGISLEFDQKTKIITESSQCCAGAGLINSTYKVKNNKMILLRKVCLEYNEKSGDYKTVKCDK
jgi:hypothetical protein